MRLNLNDSDRDSGVLTCRVASATPARDAIRDIDIPILLASLGISPGKGQLGLGIPLAALPIRKPLVCIVGFSEI
jgi:hypothetical protein